MTVTEVFAPAVVDHDQLAWLAPAPLWEDGSIGAGEPDFEQPRLVELTTDDFVDEFLAYLSGDDPAGEGPGGLHSHRPKRMPRRQGDGTVVDYAGTTDDPIVLYQPMHQRFYMVVASLVCRRIGLPDRKVAPIGERISFVVRRLVTRVGPNGAETQAEQAWLAKSSSWVDVADPSVLFDGEEQHPMHSAPVDAPIATGPAAELLGLDEPGRRKLHFGYVPVAGRTNKPATLSDDAALAALKESDSGAKAGDDPRLMAWRLRIGAAWSDLAARRATVEAAGGTTAQIKERVKRLKLHEPSLYVLLDMRDWLQTYLPDVLTALVNNTELPTGSPASWTELRNALEINVKTGDPTDDSQPTIRLGKALGDLATFVSLLWGDPKTKEPDTHYDLSVPLAQHQAWDTTINSLGGTSPNNGGKVGPALVDQKDPARAAKVPDELSGMIVARPADAAELDDRHVLRLVYEHEPCAPVLSKPSAVVRFAGVFDPDAPARRVRIQVPDPIHMRRFNRGVAIEMPPNLRRILDGVTPKLLKEEPLGAGGDWGIGMICSFSFQIFFVLSFIIAFIFLILLNIAFWWLAFIKICFPIPMKKSGSG